MSIMIHISPSSITVSVQQECQNIDLSFLFFVFCLCTLSSVSFSFANSEQLAGSFLGSLVMFLLVKIDCSYLSERETDYSYASNIYSVNCGV